MDLGQKVRTAACGLMLGAATIGTLGGCTSFGPWENAKTEESPAGTIRTETKNAGTKIVKERTLNISEPYVNNGNYQVRITDSADNTFYKLEERIDIEGFRKVQVQERDKRLNIFTPILIPLGAFGGLATGMILTMNKPSQVGGALVGTSGGALIGAGLSALIKPIKTGTETRKQDVGFTNKPFSKGIRESFLERVVRFRNGACSNVKWGFVGKSDTYQSDANGVITFMTDEPANFVTKENLERRLYDIPLVAEILPETRNALRQRLLDAVTQYTQRGSIETREIPSGNSETVKNASKVISMNYFILTDNAIYLVVQQFVNEEINSSLRTIEFKVKDDLTHVPIMETNFEFSTDAPSKSKLLEKYFTGGLKIYAERFILDYLSGKGRIQSASDNIKFTVYSPSNIFLEVTHPDYNFVSEEKAIRGSAKGVIYMVDKGSKIRLQNSKEIPGRVEWEK